MSEFSAKIHQIRFRLGLRHDPVGELAALRQAPNWWGGGWLPPPQEPYPALGPLGLDIRLTGPRYFVPPAITIPPDLMVLK